MSDQCRRAGRFGMWCMPMREALNHSTETGKGLAQMLGWVEGGRSDVPDDARVYGVLYRVRAGHDGFVLNTCPWCGADLRWVDLPPSSTQPPTEPA